MIFREAKIARAFIVEPEPIADSRGFFARVWDTKIFAANGLHPQFVQASISFSKKAGTLRGMHYQAPPHEEAKFVRCTRGAIYDVVLDLRPRSATYRLWEAFELTAENHRMVYIPEGCAHGFQTLLDATEVSYQMTAFHTPQA